MRSIWCIGNGENGKFGIGNTEEIKELTKCKWSDDIQIKSIFPSYSYTMFQDVDGNYYSCGCNDSNECSLESKDDDVLNITPITWFAKNNIKISECYPSQSDAPFWKSEDGKIYASGNNDVNGRLGIDVDDDTIVNEISFFSNLSIIIKKIVSSRDVSIAITNDGKVYSTGYDDGNFGSNGHGAKGIENKGWEIIDSLKHVNIVDAAMGEDFTVFVSKSGQLFSCGKNDFGQLGLGVQEESSSDSEDENDDVILRVPTQIDYFTENKIVIKSVACGDVHCIALDTNGNVYSWGRNVFGQCGLENKSLAKKTIFCWLVPQLIPHLKNVHVVDAFVGNLHSAVKTNDNGYFIFGSNFCGQCCNDDGKRVKTPIFINEWISKRTNGDKILSIALGADATFVLTVNNEMCDDEKKDPTNDIIDVVSHENEERKINMNNQAPIKEKENVKPAAEHVHDNQTDQDGQHIEEK